ncbi:hypothetical protein V0U79_09050 [Hyphobacterium sp. HN65]|uniref:Uncharacterized protein n=1 Tax=Hyphobacterium lacteum TaxID=3116575 RepID=A0ABU7LRG9_9PROT|nr:hypothetical protein [Hyphobacterium sp. HN65]MEE2526512.1 hypothetical protein [Hyphobacterium sp. HN65]
MMMRLTYLIAAALAASGLPALSEAQQRTMTRPGSTQTLPLCRDAGPGEQCRTRNGEIRTRPGAQTNNLGGGNPGWEVRRENDTNNIGSTDPGWEVRRADPQAEGFTGEETVFPAAPGNDRFGGEDAGWVRAPDGGRVRPSAGGGSSPRPEAMECDLCDDDEDLPQGPIDNTPRPQPPAPEEPKDDEEEDCIWRNPPEGPDQEFCDE